MKKLLMTSYWIGIVADGLSTLLLYWPALAQWVLQPRSFELSANYLYVSRIAAALMCGWTVLLYWAQRKPVERADILLITLFPVLSLLAVAAVWAARSNAVAFGRMLPMFVLYVVLYAIFIPSFLWAKRQLPNAR